MLYNFYPSCLQISQLFQYNHKMNAILIMPNQIKLKHNLSVIIFPLSLKDG